MYAARAHQLLTVCRNTPRTFASCRSSCMNANRSDVGVPSCHLYHQLASCIWRNQVGKRLCATLIQCRQLEVEEFGVSRNHERYADSKNTHMHGFGSNSIAVPISRAYPTPTAGKINKIENGEAVVVKPTELYRDLKGMHSEDVLETFAASYQAMDKVHYALCFKRLFTVQSLFWGDKKREFIKAMYDDERFQVLCAFVTRKGAFYQASIAFDMFQFLHSFGFHDDHPAIAVYLQLLKHELNDLHLDQLLQLVDITQNMKQTKNTALIFEAVAAIIPHRTHELQALSWNQKLVALDLFHDRLKKKWLQFIWDGIVHDLEEHYPGQDEARMLLRVLSKIDLVDSNMERLCISVIERTLEAYSVCDLKDIVTSLVKLSLYCPELLNEIGHMMSKNSSEWLLKKEHVTMVALQDKLDVLNEFSKQSHINDCLLDSILQHLVDKDCSRAEMLRGLGLLSALRPKHIDKHSASKLSEYLENNHQMMNSSEDFESLMTLQTAILTLGIQTLRRLWEDRLTHVAMDLVNKQGNGSFTPLGHGGYEVSFVEAAGVLKCHGADSSLSQLSSLSEKTSPSKPSPVQGFDVALTRAFPDLPIDKDCVLDSGLTLDYVIREIHEEFKTSNNSSVAIKILPDSAFTRNNHTLKGFPHLYVNAIHNLGYTVIVVNPMKWKEIPERERTLHLRHRIQKLLRESKQDINII